MLLHGRYKIERSCAHERGFLSWNECVKSWSFRGERIQWNFLGQTAASRCEVLPTFRDLLVWYNQNIFGTTKPPAHPEDGDGVSSRYVGINLQILTRLPARENFIDSAKCRPTLRKVCVILNPFSLVGNPDTVRSGCTICWLCVLRLQPSPRTSLAPILCW